MDNYLNGYPEKAYNTLKNTLDNRVSLYSILFDTIIIPPDENFYRIRTGITNQPYSKEKMFHIPFEFRTKVSTQRHSISGFPSLYLGKSLYSAWEELNRPLLSEFQVAR